MTNDQGPEYKFTKLGRKMSGEEAEAYVKARCTKEELRGLEEVEAKFKTGKTEAIAEAVDYTAALYVKYGLWTVDKTH